jgi:CRISPR-associated protein Cas2
MALYLVAYDIASDRRRRRVARVLESFGRRIQESLFEARLEPEEASELRARLGELLAVDDLIEIAPIDERSAQRRSRWLRRVGVSAPVRVC